MESTRSLFRRSVPENWDAIEKILAVTLRDAGSEPVELVQALGCTLALDLGGLSDGLFYVCQAETETSSTIAEALKILKMRRTR